jgi:predicted RNA binding protein YcfA (HicA-like mRNA interferase family)
MPSALLESMRRNPAGDWRIRDVESLCLEYGLSFRFGKGSHAHMRHPAAREIRPIKPVYIRKLVRYIDTYGGSR